MQNLAEANAQCEDAGTTPSTAAWDDSPWATAVGGSVPNVSSTNGAKLGPDPLWHDAPPNAQFSEGAGFSAVFARPGYQNGVASITDSDMRSVPDLTMDAQDGTSEAAPMLAGVLALATQANGADLGPINPALYHTLGPAGSSDGIADVVSGNNSAETPDGQVLVPGFTAGQGFDVASGWGTVDAPNFVPSLVAATQASPRSDTPGGPPNSSSQASRPRASPSPRRKSRPARRASCPRPGSCRIPGHALGRRPEGRDAHREHARRHHLHHRPADPRPRPGQTHCDAAKPAHQRNRALQVPIAPRHARGTVTRPLRRRAWSFVIGAGEDRPRSYGCRVGKWKDARRFGPGPYVLGFQRLYWADEFPFNVPAIAKIEQLSLGESVTLLAGENGSGKSTILEAIAAAIGFAEHGGELARLGELPAVPRNVVDAERGPLLAPVLSPTKPRNGYFLRAESFFNLAEFVDSGDRFAPDVSLYGDVPLHAQSHGESFLALAANRFGADGLYLLDEPEAALSLTGALALLAIVTRAANSAPSS